MMNESELENYFWILIPLGSIYIFFVLRFAYYQFRLNSNVKMIMKHEYYVKRPTIEGRKEIRNIIKESPVLLKMQSKAFQSWKYGLIYMAIIFIPIFAYAFISIAGLEK